MAELSRFLYLAGFYLLPVFMLALPVIVNGLLRDNKHFATRVQARPTATLLGLAFALTAARYAVLGLTSLMHGWGMWVLLYLFPETALTLALDGFTKGLGSGGVLGMSYGFAISLPLCAALLFLFWYHFLHRIAFPRS